MTECLSVDVQSLRVWRQLLHQTLGSVQVSPTAPVSHWSCRRGNDLSANANLPSELFFAFHFLHTDKTQPSSLLLLQFVVEALAEVLEQPACKGTTPASRLMVQVLHVHVNVLSGETCTAEQSLRALVELLSSLA